EHHLHILTIRGAWVKIGCQGNSEAMIEETFRRWVGGAEGEGTAREQSGDDARVSQGVQVGVAGEVQMVGGGGAQFCGKARAAKWTKLLGVDFQEIAKFFGASEDAAAFCEGEGAFFTEDIAKARLPCKGGQHVVDDQINVCLAPVLVF